MGAQSVSLNTNCKYAHSLENNFREIYHALKFPSKETPALIANLSATRIYDSRYGWGRLWRWFYRIANWITGASLNEEKLKQAILNTHTLFQQVISLNERHLKKYLEYLEKSGKGYSVNEDHYFLARNRISEWNTATKPLLKLLTHQRLELPFLDHFPPEVAPSLFSSSTTPLFHHCQKIIDLEGMIGAPLPLSVLKKIIREKPLNSIDQKDLDKWIYKIEKQDLKVTSVYKALTSLTEIYKKHQEDSLKQETLPKLLLFLEDRGCKTFQKQEKKHVAWRQHLEEGEKFSLNSSEIILGQELYPQASGSDQTRAYRIQGQSDRIAIIAQNKVVLMMRDFKMHRQNYFGIAPAFLLDISPDGKIATMEHLKKLNTIKWASQGNQLNCQDEPLINVLTQLIQSFIKYDITPAKFTPDHLMFNEQLELKSLKPLIKGPFDFNALEDFIVECASGNLTIYKELMTRSGLSSHAIAKFYRDLISNNFFEKKEAPDDLAGIYRIGDPKVVDRGAALLEQINAIKRQVHPRLRELFPKYSSEQIEKKMKCVLIKLYITYKSAGVLWPTLPEDAWNMMVSETLA